MNEEIDDNEFYHQDFTTASEWEIFIARMEEIVNQWKTDETSNESQVEKCGDWEIKAEKIMFVDFEFNMFLYRKRTESSENSESSEENEKQTKNPIDTLYDFEPYIDSNTADHSCLSTWYGIDEYYILAPAVNMGITNESKIKILLSSIYVVSSSINCEIPFFVQIREKWQRCYLGVFEGDGIRTNFEMVHLRRGPPHCYYLNGLLDMFKSKIMSPSSLDPITVSVQLKYNLTDFGSFQWKQDPFDSESFDVDSLPFGVSVDPVSSLTLKATWNHLADNIVMDSEGHSDFDPITAPKWSCLVNMTNEPVCLLGDAFSEFLQSLSNTANVYDILGDYASLPSSESNPFDVLTEPAVPTISTLLIKAARRSSKSNKASPPIAEGVLVPLLYYLFPDADEGAGYPYGGRDEKECNEKTKGNEMFKNLEDEFKGYKTCTADCLTWRLAIVLTHALQSLGGVRALSHIWYEFVQEMRYRWEKSMPIPGLAPGFPDLRTCLLNQKLQMLNCCIERKLSRENANQPRYDSAENSSDEEYFDCSEKPDDENRRKHSLWNQPVGRLTKFGDMKLLKTGDPLYIPVTQEPVLKTEDQLEEDTDVLLKLGSDAGATELRARIMSASLLSDMESFKAANPGSIVEDFIRWYSPRDWIEEEELDEWGQKKGHLSPRMLIEENNIWVQMWESAKPVPAHRQKRLFDDTREAEKVLQFLDFRTIGQVCELVIPVLCHCAIYRLIEECQLVSVELPDGRTRVQSLLRHGERISRDVKFQPRRFEAFLLEMTALELAIAQVNSLQYKLNPSGSQNEVIGHKIADLVAGKEVTIEGKDTSEIGGRIISMFGEVQKLANLLANDGGENPRNVSLSIFPSPAEKEFVMRVNAVKPASYSAKCPQYLRAIIGRQDFRLVGAFSEDVVFF